MKKINKEIPGLKIIKFKKFVDKRGFFLEVYNKKKQKNINLSFVQQNLSFSKKINTFRGLHFQKGKWAQDKFLIVIRGEIVDFILDLRPNSKTYLKFKNIKINEKSNFGLYIPKGCAHGFLTKKKNTTVIYNTTSTYSKSSERGINYKSLNTKFPNKITLSKKDALLPILNIKL